MYFMNILAQTSQHAVVRHIFAFVHWLRVHQHRHALPKDVEIFCNARFYPPFMQVELFTSASNSKALWTYYFAIHAV